jgi:hypothetical protein
MQGFKRLLERRDLWALKDHKKDAEKGIDFDHLIDKIHALKHESKGEVGQEVSLVVDSSKKDYGTLIKLNSLQKRLMCIKHVVGDWQPSRRHKNVTE